RRPIVASGEPPLGGRRFVGAGGGVDEIVLLISRTRPAAAPTKRRPPETGLRRAHLTCSGQLPRGGPTCNASCSSSHRSQHWRRRSATPCGGSDRRWRASSSASSSCSPAGASCTT